MNRTALTNCETGQNRPSIEAGAAICAKYNLTLDWLYLGKEDGMMLKDLRALGLHNDSKN